MKVLQAKVADLRCSPENPRTITKARLEQLQRALTADPEMLKARPIIALPDGTVVADNQRLVAAQGLGWKTIPTVTVDIDPERARLWMLRDNQGYGEWEDTLVSGLLAEMSAAGTDLDLTGFESQDIDRLLRATSPRDPDDAPPLPSTGRPSSKLGQAYELGRHRLLCGDATDRDQVFALMDGEKAAMVFTDPPYGVDYDGGTKARKKLAGDASTDLYAPACLMAAGVSTNDAPLYLWHAGVKGIAAAAAAAAAGYEIRCEIVWNKNQAQFGALSAQYKQKREPCYYCFKRGRRVNWIGPKNEVTVWDVDRSSVNEFHPTQKPVALATRALTNHDAPTVLDLFAGSGSTLIAAEMQGRRCFAMEIDPAYCDVIRARYEAFVGA